MTFIVDPVSSCHVIVWLGSNVNGSSLSGASLKLMNHFSALSSTELSCETFNLLFSHLTHSSSNRLSLGLCCACLHILAKWFCLPHDLQVTPYAGHSNNMPSHLAFYFCLSPVNSVCYMFGVLILNVAHRRYNVQVSGSPPPIFLICLCASSLELHVNGFVQCECRFSEHSQSCNFIFSAYDKPVTN